MMKINSAYKILVIGDGLNVVKYMLQCEDHVLHISGNNLINILDVDALSRIIEDANYFFDVKTMQISQDEFEENLKQTIFNLGLYKYAKNFN